MKEFSLSLENIKAESFLSTAIDSIEKTEIEFLGVFSRNYHNDITEFGNAMESSENQFSFKLSRDSLFNILPEGLFFNEELLRRIDKEKNKEKFRATAEKITKEKQKIKRFLHPFDKTYFNYRFQLEKKLNEAAIERTQLFIDELLNIYNINRENQLINRITTLLPIASEIRGNKMIWRDIFKNLFYPAEVKVFIIEKRNQTGILSKIVKVNININKLSNARFKSIKKDVDVFAQFFYEWFLPADMGYEFKIKDTDERFILGSDLTLDYNTYLAFGK